MSRITRHTAFVTGLVLSISLAGCGGDHQDPAESSLPAVEASLVASESIQIPQRIEVRGTVEAERSAAVSSRVTAMVTSLAVRSGDRVRKGQILLEIDPATARGQLSQASGALAQAQAALALATRNYDRFKVLAETNAASELELDMARMQYEQAAGAVEQAEGAVRAARSVASESSVRAPFDGLIVRRMVEVGDLAAPGRPLLMIESERGRRLALAVPASLMAKAMLAVGDTLGARIDGYDELGEISTIVVERSSAADPITHSFDVKADLGETDVPSGSTGRAWLTTGAREAIVVPSAATYRRGGLTLVVIRNSDGNSESRIVTLGSPLEGDKVEVLSGLSGGEILLAGLGAVPPNGSPVVEGS